MNTRISCLPVCCLCVCLLLCAGCTSPASPPAVTPPAGTPAATPALSPATTPATPVPSPATPLQPSPVTTIPVTAAIAATPTWIEKAYGRDALDNPQILLLTFKKQPLIFNIPDCGMRAEFPEAAADPAYGIRSRNSRLLMESSGRVDAFIASYAEPTRYIDIDPQLNVDPAKIGGPACNGVIATPEWNFVRVNATFVARNARPSVYDIGLNIKSHGDVIEQIPMNMTLELDKTVSFVGYIPLRVDQMEAFDNVELVFFRRS